MPGDAAVHTPPALREHRLDEMRANQAAPISKASENAPVSAHVATPSSRWSGSTRTATA
jgi:hypothetical protein